MARKTTDMASNPESEDSMEELTDREEVEEEVEEDPVMSKEQYREVKRSMKAREEKQARKAAEKEEKKRTMEQRKRKLDEVMDEDSGEEERAKVLAALEDMKRRKKLKGSLTEESESEVEDTKPTNTAQFIMKHNMRVQQTAKDSKKKKKTAAQVPPKKPSKEKASSKATTKDDGEEELGSDASEVDDGELENEAACKEWHSKLRDFGIRVMSAKLESYDQGTLCGYLGLTNSSRLAAAYDCLQPKNPTMRHTWTDFVNLHNIAYTMPDLTKPPQITKKKLLNQFTLFESRTELARLTTAERIRPQSDPAFLTVSNTNINYHYYIWVAMICICIRQYPDIFTESHDVNFTGSKFLGATNMDLSREDVLRAYFFIRMYLRQLSRKTMQIGKGKGFKNARQLRWFDPQAGGGPETAGADRPPAAAATTKLQLDQQTFGSTARGIDMNNPAAFRAIFQRFCKEHDEARELGEAEDSDNEGNDNHDGDRFTAKVLAELRAQDEGASIQRDPLSRQQIEDFLWMVGHQVTIKFDGFSDVDDTAEHHGMVAASENALLGPEYTTNMDDDQLFWDNKDMLVSQTANIPTWDEACTGLGIATEIAAAGPNAIEIPHSKYKPKAYQVIAAYWMRLQEAGPIGGGILAMDAGLGKTLTSLYFILLQGSEIEKKMAAKQEKVKAKPTMVLCPSGLIDTWYKEINLCFGHYIKIRLYYSNATENTLNTHQKGLLLSTDPTKAAAEIRQIWPTDQADSAFGVVLCAYETHTKRNLQQTTELHNQQQMIAEGLFDSDGTSPEPSPPSGPPGTGVDRRPRFSATAVSEPPPRPPSPPLLCVLARY